MNELVPITSMLMLRPSHRMVSEGDAYDDQTVSPAAARPGLLRKLAQRMRDSIASLRRHAR